MIPQYPRNDMDYVRKHLLRATGNNDIVYFMICDGYEESDTHVVHIKFLCDISDEVKMLVAMDLALDCYNTYGTWPLELPPEKWLKEFDP